MVHKVLNTVRWRLIPVRYVGKVARSLVRRSAIDRFSDMAANDEPGSNTVRDMIDNGFATGPTISSDGLAKMQAIYRPRGALVQERTGGHPFVNIFTDDDVSADNPVFRFAVSPEVLDAAHDYFGGRFIFDSIQVLHSWPTSGELAESQFWHKDYGDSRAFHCVAYLTDVLSDDAGPFVFADKQDSSRIRKSLMIRRIDDARFAQELAGGSVRTFYGKAGESVLVDPSQCYHYGSRCRTPRQAIFVTFSTDRPFVGAQPIIRRNASRAANMARKVRPDLSQSYLNFIFGA